MELNKLYHGDCFEILPKIKDRSIDLILCDLPYGTTRNDWDVVLPYDKLWEHYNRIIKDNGAILLFSQTPFDKELGYSNLKMLRYEWIWEKGRATGFLNASKNPLKAHENILVFYKHLPTYNPIKTMSTRKVSLAAHKIKCSDSSNYGKQVHTKDYNSDERYPRTVLKFSSCSNKDKHHPTEKPVELMKYFIKTYTNVEDTVLDNCMGSGTVPVACVQTNRKFIGIEINETYYNIAKERVQNANGNVGLFDDNISATKKQKM